MNIRKGLMACGLLLLPCLNQASPTEDLDKKIRRYASDHEIDAYEKQQITGYIEDHKADLPHFFGADGKLLTEAVNAYLAGKPLPSAATASPVAQAPAAPLGKVSLYVDETGSMRGLIDDKSRFPETLGSLITRIEDQYNTNKLSLNAINSGKITAINASPQAFIRDLLNKVAHYNKKGKSKPTEILDIVSQVVDKVSEGQVSILLSDFNANSLPINADLQKSALTNALNAKLKTHDLAVVMLRFSADDKPYYALILAKQALMQELAQHINLDKLPGFQSKIGFKNNASQAIDYTVLSDSFKKGSFRPDRAYREKTYIQHLTSLDFDRHGSLQFAVAVDFSPLLAYVSNDYLTDTSHFSLNSFTLKEVQALEGKQATLHERDQVTLRQHPFTHYLLLETQSKQPLSDLTIELVTTPPHWDDGNSNLNDLLAAIAEAYKIHNNDKNTLVTLTIGIKE